jgi:hypothetical protein
MKTVILPAGTTLAQIKQLMPQGGTVRWVYKGKQRSRAVNGSGGA